ncbi:MAG TPA: hypothetical protein VFU14_15395 [Acidimicrobiales bacterium]|nr:hypothetical protein [Acidimicrobiales bacterium]
MCSLRSMGMALVISSVLLAGCGGDDDDTVPAEGAPIASTTTEQVSTPPADGDTVTVVLHDLRGAAGQQHDGFVRPLTFSGR